MSKTQGNGIVFVTRQIQNLGISEFQNSRFSISIFFCSLSEFLLVADVGPAPKTFANPYRNVVPPKMQNDRKAHQKQISGNTQVFNMSKPSAKWYRFSTPAKFRILEFQNFKIVKFENFGARKSVSVSPHCRGPAD